jgi:hypothetical protein
MPGPADYPDIRGRELPAPGQAEHELAVVPDVAC